MRVFYLVTITYFIRQYNSILPICDFILYKDFYYPGFLRVTGYVCGLIDTLSLSIISKSQWIVVSEQLSLIMS